MIEVPTYERPEDAYKDLLTIRVMSGGQGELPIVPVGHNGVFYDVPRGVTVRVPRAVAAILEGSYTWPWVISHKTGGLAPLAPIPLYPLMVLPDDSEAPALKQRKPLAANERIMLERAAQAERARGRTGSGARVGVAPYAEGDAQSADVAGKEIEV